MKDNECVKTAIRWRPSEENEDVIIKKINEQAISFGSQSKTFCFDHVIDSSYQNEVYKILVEPLVGKALEGYDCTFLASGQTGSGKTYTMGFESNVTSENNGMTLRVLNSIFSYADDELVGVSISFVEVYNDQAFDLLEQNPQQRFLKKDLGMSGANKKSVKNESQVLALLTQGTKNRHVRGTKMNATSSRSHAVFSIKLRIQNSENKIRESVINLVDLAGSECIDKTGNTGKESIVEGKSINESLSAFKRVIIAMSCGANHIPYRDSVITYILRKSLEINCYLTLLGCVSPFQRDYGETLSTLNFVADAKLIKRTPQLNAVINESQSQNLQTPAKMSFQTPTSSKRFTASFNQRLSLSSIQNKLLLPPVPMSEPRYGSIGHSSTVKRFGRKSIPNSTNKTMRQPFGVDRFKIVNKVLPATGNRKVPDSSSSLQNSDFKNNNFNEASTTSVVNFESCEFDSTKKSLERQYTINTPEFKRIADRLAKEAKKIMDNGFNFDIMDVLGVALTKINEENSTIVGSFHSTPNRAAMLSTVMETECSHDVTLEDEPIKDQMFSISSTEGPIVDPIPSLNVSIRCDHVEKKILVEVTNANSIDVPALQIVSPEIASVYATQEADFLINNPTQAIVSQEIISPEIVSPEVVSPEVVSPEVGSPEVGSPEVGSPEVGSPEIVSQEIVSQEIASPDTTQEADVLINDPTQPIVSQEIISPEIVSPEVVSPEVGSPEVGSPEVGSPEVASPEVGSPEIVSQESVSQEIVSQEIVSPEIVSPEIVSQEIVSQEIVSQEIASPDTTQEADVLINDPTQPIVSQDIISPEIVSPEIVFPEVVSPEVVSSEVVSPEVVSPEVVSPEVVSPEIASPDTTQEADVLINDPTQPIVSPEIALPDTTQEADVLINDQFDPTNDLFDDEIVTGDQTHPLNQTPIFVDNILNNETMENSSPIMKNTTVTYFRTPIGKLIIRRVAHANQFEATQYAVEIVHKVQRLQENIPEISPPTIEMDYDYEVIEMPKTKKQLFSTSSPIASGASRSAYRSRKSPRLVLHRVSSIQDYNRHEQVPLQGVTRHKRKLNQVESALTEEATPSSFKKSNKNTHRLSTSSPIASEASYSAYPSRKSPRLVLHRISSIQDYNRHEQVPLQAVTRLKRKLTQFESARTKEVTPSPSSFEMKYAGIKKPNKNSHRSSTSSPIADKISHHFPKQPRLVLHRVTIEDYLQQHRPQPVTKVKQKVTQTKSARTKCRGKKCKPQPKEMDSISRILEILNTENENGLRKRLATIGAKKAQQIFNYRAAKGEFKSINGLLKMPFWSKNTHERFIANNIFV